uniref:SAP domain-containing protein n=1 Tax=Aegilops tauschii subsp. strangulata TaxID=200361 RepID=A0A453K893_AEGTS
MDFAAMKRRELQALCKEHGLKANGSNADLAARLAATLSVWTLGFPLALLEPSLFPLGSSPCFTRHERLWKWRALTLVF